MNVIILRTILSTAGICLPILRTGKIVPSTIDGVQILIVDKEVILDKCGHATHVLDRIVILDNLGKTRAADRIMVTMD